MSDQKYKVSFGADFKGLVKDAEKASSKLNDLFSEAIEKGIKSTSIQKLSKDLEKAAKREAEVRAKIDKKLKDKELRDAKDIEAERAKAERNLATLTRKIQNSSDKKRKKELIKYRKQVEETLSVFGETADQFEDSLHRSYTELEEIVAGMKQAEKSAETIAKELGKGADVFSTKIRETLSNAPEMAQSFADALTSSIDSGHLARSLGKALGRGLSLAGEHAGGGGMSEMLGVMGGLASIVGTLAGLFFDTDKKVREFNKTAVKTFGARSIAQMGVGNFAEGLRTLNHATLDLTQNFGVAQDEAMGLFDTLDRGGITLDTLTGGTRDAAVAQQKLSASLRETYSVANATGVGLTEYADNLTNYVNDLGMSLDTVNNSFANIAKMASASAFGTRRFYSMVVQATAGQSSLNVRLEDTADLLMKMTKILGQKKALEMAGTASGDMGAASGTDRIKHTLLSGAAGRERFRTEARQQTTSFAQGANALIGPLTKALNQAGLSGRGIAEAVAQSANSAPEEQAQNTNNLMRRMQSLSRRDQTLLVAQLRQDPQTEGLARQMDQLISLNRAAGGNMSDMVNAMETMSAGGSIGYHLDEVQNVLGKRLEDMNAAERAAAESILGVSGHQYDAMRDLSRGLAGNFAILTRATQENVQVGSDQDKQLARLYGATVRDGRIVAAHFNESTGQVEATNTLISHANDLAQSQTQATVGETQDLREETTQLGYQTMEATVSIADILENKIAQILQSTYDVVSGPILNLISHIPGVGGAATAAVQQRDIAAAITKSIEALTSERSGRATEIAGLQATVHSSSTPAARRTAAQAELTRLQTAQADADTRLQALRGARQRAQAGDFQKTTTTDRWTVDQMGRDEGGRRTARSFNTREEALAAVGGDESQIHQGTTTRDSTTDEIVQSLEAQGDQAVDHRHQAVREAKALERRQRYHLDGILTGPKVGNALADSNLPTDIAEANAAQNLKNELISRGLTREQVSGVMATGSLEGTSVAGDLDLTRRVSGMFGPDAPSPTVAPAAHDFVYQNGVRPTITPIDREDQVVGTKAGGPVSRAGAGGGGNVNIHVYGGDEGRIYNVIKRVLRDSGMTPNRVTSHA